MFVDRYLCMTRAQHTGVFVRVTLSSVEWNCFQRSNGMFYASVRRRQVLLCFGIISREERRDAMRER